MSARGGTGPGPGGRLIYSVQRTYMLKAVATAEAEVLTCDQRIDIPVIEPLANVQAVVYHEQPRTVVPCIEITGINLNDVVLKFETNEGVTYTPITIGSGMQYPLENPYLPYRHVLVLPRGTTGIKSCKVITHAGTEIQNSLTFGILPPPYNYDNALFGYISYAVGVNSRNISELESDVSTLYSNVDAAFTHLREGFYELQVANSRFPVTSTPISENLNLSMIKFRVTNNTGAKAQMELEFIYRTEDDSTGKDMFAVPIAAGENSVVIDIDKGTITTIADSTAEPFMFSFPAKYGNHVITALNKASITGDTTAGLINYSYYFKPYLVPVG